MKPVFDQMRRLFSVLRDEREQQKSMVTAQTESMSIPKFSGISMEMITNVLPGGLYRVAGYTLSATGEVALSAGQQVPVAWRKGIPVAIVAHNARRAAMDTTTQTQVMLSQIVEELLLVRVTGGSKIYFRNDQQVTDLKLDAFLVEAVSVQWGVDRNSFFVITGDGSYKIFKMNRKQDVPLGSARASARFVKSITPPSRELPFVYSSFTLAFTDPPPPIFRIITTVVRNLTFPADVQIRGLVMGEGTHGYEIYVLGSMSYRSDAFFEHDVVGSHPTTGGYGTFITHTAIFQVSTGEIVYENPLTSGLTDLPPPTDGVTRSIDSSGAFISWSDKDERKRRWYVSYSDKASENLITLGPSGQGFEALSVQNTVLSSVRSAAIVERGAIKFPLPSGAVELYEASYLAAGSDPVVQTWNTLPTLSVLDAPRSAQKYTMLWRYSTLTQHLVDLGLALGHINAIVDDVRTKTYSIINLETGKTVDFLTITVFTASYVPPPDSSGTITTTEPPKLAGLRMLSPGLLYAIPTDAPPITLTAAYPTIKEQKKFVRFLLGGAVDPGWLTSNLQEDPTLINKGKLLALPTGMNMTGIGTVFQALLVSGVRR